LQEIENKSRMELTLGFSPCPNDTFIFDALVNQKIDTEGVTITAVLEDVETLNRWALEGKLDITKLSFPAYFRSIDNYRLLNTGSALGKGVGPLLVSRTDPSKINLQPGKSKVALPGVNTTANLLFNFAYPGSYEKKYLVFSEIEDAVLRGETDFGVIIHENRFTYQQKGLFKVKDLGEYWEEKMQVPIPLGGIAIRKTIDVTLADKIDKLIRKSLEFAFSNYPAISHYVKMHSQTMSEEVMRQHIELYVNDYSLDLGETGRNAIQTLYKVFQVEKSIS
jgi:1,4-dihydroxy-6-naphthoate synthase